MHISVITVKALAELPDLMKEGNNEKQRQTTNGQTLGLNRLASLGVGRDKYEQVIETGTQLSFFKLLSDSPRL